MALMPAPTGETSHFKTTPQVIGKRIIDFQDGYEKTVFRPGMTLMTGMTDLIKQYSKGLDLTDEIAGPQNAYSVLEKIVTFREEAEVLRGKENVTEVYDLGEIRNFRAYALSALIEHPSFEKGLFEKVLTDQESVRKLLNLALESDLNTMDISNKENVHSAPLQIPEDVFQQFRKFKEDLNEQESSPQGQSLA